MNSETIESPVVGSLWGADPWKGPHPFDGLEVQILPSTTADTVMYRRLTGPQAGQTCQMNFLSFVTSFKKRDVLADQLPKVRQGETWYFTLFPSECTVVSVHRGIVTYKHGDEIDTYGAATEERFLENWTKERPAKLIPDDGDGRRFIYVVGTEDAVMSNPEWSQSDAAYNRHFDPNCGIFKVPVDWDAAEWVVEPT